MTHGTPFFLHGERALAKGAAGAVVELTDQGRLESESGSLPFAAMLQAPRSFTGRMLLTNLRILYVEDSAAGLFSIFLPTVRAGQDVSRHTESLMKVRRIRISTRRLHCDFVGKGLETMLRASESAKRELTPADLRFLKRELMAHPDRCGTFSPATRALMSGVNATLGDTEVQVPAESVALTLAHELFVLQP